MSKIFVEDTEMRDIADAIREKNGTENTYKPSEMPQAIKDIENDNNNPELTILADLAYKSSRLELAGLPITEIELDCTHKTSFQYMFQNCNKLITAKLRNTQNVSNWYFAFVCPELVTLDELDFSSTTSAIGQFRCPKVINFRIVAKTLKISADFSHLTSLNDASIQSIIDGLVKYEGIDTPPTLTLNSTIKSNLTQEQISKITIEKNWTLA